MKNSQTCPKCQQQRIVRIPGQAGSDNNIPVGFTIFSSIMVTHSVCTGYAFSKEWIESPADLDTLQEKFG